MLRGPLLPERRGGRLSLTHTCKDTVSRRGHVLGLFPRSCRLLGGGPSKGARTVLAGVDSRSCQFSGERQAAAQRQQRQKASRNLGLWLGAKPVAYMGVHRNRGMDRPAVIRTYGS